MTTKSTKPARKKFRKLYDASVRITLDLMLDENQVSASSVEEARRKAIDLAKQPIIKIFREMIDSGLAEGSPLSTWNMFAFVDHDVIPPMPLAPPRRALKSKKAA